jgi:DNA methylase
MQLNTRKQALPSLRLRHSRALNTWLSQLDANAPTSSNMPSMELPFQRWFKFKEAFSPALIIDLLEHSSGPVRTCLDPFGGCGTTGVTCQFLGISPVLVEVNPFIADLAEAKLASYGQLELLDSFYEIVSTASRRVSPIAHAYMESLPATFCEPGVQGRYLFRRDTLGRILAYREAIACLTATHARLFRVLLGSILVACSNAVVNGKGRKYRGQWQIHQKTPEDVDRLFAYAFSRAIEDLGRYSDRAEQNYSVVRGSCIDQVTQLPPVDTVIFSPPYPNSFDYTDIYNIELWILGYLGSARDNIRLRKMTLRSHVQCTFETRATGIDSPLLSRTVRKLRRYRDKLWDPRIPEMIEGYFADLTALLTSLRETLRERGSMFLVVGDSCYLDVPVRVADILAEIAESAGYEVRDSKTLRQMRTSAQQGGSHRLNEAVLHLRNRKH